MGDPVQYPYLRMLDSRKFGGCATQLRSAAGEVLLLAAQHVRCGGEPLVVHLTAYPSNQLLCIARHSHPSVLLPARVHAQHAHGSRPNVQLSH